MKALTTLIFFLILGLSQIHAQDQVSADKKPGYKLPYVIEGKDTLPVYTLDDVQFTEKLDDETIKKQKAWNTMVYDVIKVWPYANMCSGKMKQIDSDLSALNHKR